MTIDFTATHTLFLTATNRLAEHCLQQALQTNLRPQRTPPIVSLAHWAERLFLDQPTLHKNRNILSKAQSGLLWRQLLASEPNAGLLLENESVLDSLQKAWHLCQNYLIDFQHPSFAETEESRLYQSLAQRYAAYCANQHCLDHSALLAALTQSLHAKALSVNTLVWLGFAQFTPAQQALYNRCQALGVHCQHFSLAARTLPPETPLITAIDQSEEFTHMARFAKHLASTQPKATLGCIVADLDQQRRLVKRTFDLVFSASPQTNDCFSLSGGDPLSTAPVIQTALKIFHLLTEDRWAYVDLCDLLKSPFLLGSVTEQFQRACLDHYLSNQSRYYYTANSLHQQAHRCPQLQHLLHAHHQLTQRQTEFNLQSLHTPATWIAYFCKILSAWGWPGERTLNSQEYQTVQRFQAVLAEWAKGDLVVDKLSLTTAEHALTQCLNTVMFQVQHPPQKIQILTPLEATGLRFDYLWITSMDERTWPKAAQPSAWIPLLLQHQHQLPHHSHAWEADYAALQLQQFYGAAEHLIVSHTLQNNELKVQASTFIHGLAESSVPLALYTPLAKSLYDQASTETFVDEQAPPIAETETLKGGTRLIQDFAACPFKAFAHHRLHARTLNTPSLHVTPAVRGLMLHRSLELIWTELKTQLRLNAMSSSELLTLVEHATQQALLHCELSPQILGNACFNLEARRLTELVLEWLAFEKTRPPFKVLACEHWFTATLNDLSLHVQMDRMDELCDGSLILIDYKTAPSHVDHWFGPRMQAPQLPIYFSFYTDRPLSGLAFAEIRNNALCFKGLASNTESLPGLLSWEEYGSDNPSLTAQQSIAVNWRMQLTALAEAFQAGNAAVAPLEPSSCHYCDLQPFCRIHEKKVS